MCKAGRYRELVALLAARDQEEAALDSLRQLCQDPEGLPVSPQGAYRDPHEPELLVSDLGGLLCKAGRYSKLVALLAANDQGEAALESVRQLSQDPEDLPVIPKGTCRYCA